MQITFKNKKMIVTHPTGVISEYTKDDLDKFRMDIKSDIERLNKQKTEIEQEQAEIDATTSD